MSFEPINVAKCVASGSATSGDPRCSSPEFAKANPDICAGASYLLIKPEFSLTKRLGSVKFNVFEYKDSVETQVTDGIQFTSSDNRVFVVGSFSGVGSGLKAGNVTVTATRNGKSATAKVTVMDSSGCAATVVRSVLLVDDSLSMNLPFGDAYGSRLDFALSAAVKWGTLSKPPKDYIKLYSFSDLPNMVLDFTQSQPGISSAINSVAPSGGKTRMLDAFKAAASSLPASLTGERVIVIFSDGENTSAAEKSDLIAAAASFRQSGGIVVCVGIRTSRGFDLLERVSTGGFFINAMPENVKSVMGGLTYLKSILCAGACVPTGDYWQNMASLDYSSLKNWEVLSGRVNLLGNGFMDFCPGNGLYLQLSGDGYPAIIRSIDAFNVVAGNSYSVELGLAGNHTSSVSSPVRVSVEVGGLEIYSNTISVGWDSDMAASSLSFKSLVTGQAKLKLADTGNFSDDHAGVLLGSVRLTEAETQTMLLFDNFDSENPAYVPPACGDSLARDAIPNTKPLSAQAIYYPGGNMFNIRNEHYYYRLSYVTDEGQTAGNENVDVFSDVTDGYGEGVATTNRRVRVSLPPIALNVAGRIRLARLWRLAGGGAVPVKYYLLAELNPQQPLYFDSETTPEFNARLDQSVFFPAVNTTGKISGELGTGYNCYDGTCEPEIAIGPQSADPIPLPDVESGVTDPGWFSQQQACVSCQSGWEPLPGYPSQVCKSGSAFSFVSQLDADNNARRAAERLAGAELKCRQAWTSTRQYKAVCEDSFGPDVTKVVTYTSYESQTDADTQAYNQAKAAAEAALVCTGSNNESLNNVPAIGSANEKGAAKLYPWVHYISGLTGVVTNVKVLVGPIQHATPGDIQILLRSPSGRTVILLAGCGAENSTVVGQSDSPHLWTCLKFDDAGITMNPAERLPFVSTGAVFSPPNESLWGAVKPQANPTSLKNYPFPSSINGSKNFPPTHGDALSHFSGDSPNGAWQLWVADIREADSGTIGKFKVVLTTA